MQNKHVFIVTSCMKPHTGIIPHEERFKQTVESFDSIRKMVPDAFIIFSDCSVFEITPEEMDIINPKIDLHLDFRNVHYTQEFNKHGLKSHGELYMLYYSVLHYKDNYDTDLDGTMFKLGARCKLNDDFDANKFDEHKGKYVFKTRLDTWRNQAEKEKGWTHLLETRLYSWSFSLIDDYIQVLAKNLGSLSQGLDTEHAHLLHIDPDKLIEIPMVNCSCTIAADGKLMLD